MIKYTLKCKSTYCSNQNNFDGWFRNMESFEKQKSKDLILCPLKATKIFVKSLSTPAFSRILSVNCSNTEKTYISASLFE